MKTADLNNKTLTGYNFFTLSDEKRLIQYRIGSSIIASFILGLIIVNPFVNNTNVNDYIEYMISGASLIVLPFFIEIFLKNRIKLNIFKKYSNYGIEYKFFCYDFKDFDEIIKVIENVKPSLIVDFYEVDKLNGSLRLKFNTGLKEYQSWLQIATLHQIRGIIGNNYKKFEI